MTASLKRYFVYMLPKGSDTYDVVVIGKPASSDTLLEYHDITGIVPRIQPIVLSLAICERDLSALAQLPASQERRLNAIGTPDIPAAFLNDMLVESAGSVNAFLASTSAFLGQAPQMVAAVLRNDSQLFANWDARRNQLHANSVGYRMLYELRNFAQHYALPISGFRVSGQRDLPDGPLSMTCGAHLTRDALLSSGYDWRSRTADIAAQSADFDVLPLAEDYMRCLRVLLLEAARSCANELAVCSDYLRKLRELFKVPPAARLYLFNGLPNVQGGHPTSAELVPDEQFQWIVTALQRAEVGSRATEAR